MNLELFIQFLEDCKKYKVPSTTFPTTEISGTAPMESACTVIDEEKNES